VVKDHHPQMLGLQWPPGDGAADGRCGQRRCGTKGGGGAAMELGSLSYWDISITGGGNWG